MFWAENAGIVDNSPFLLITPAANRPHSRAVAAGKTKN